MSDSHAGHDHDEGHGHGGQDEGRSTAPMSEFTANQAAVGATIALVGILFVFILPMALTL